MTCRHCSTHNDTDARYCKQCGNALESADIFAPPARKDVSDAGYLWMAIISLVNTIFFMLIVPFLIRLFSGPETSVLFYRSWGVGLMLIEFCVLAYFTRNQGRRIAVICIGALLLIANLVAMSGLRF